MRKRLTAIVLTAIITVSSFSSVMVLADTYEQILQQQNEELKANQSKLSEAQRVVEELNSKIELLDYEIEDTLYEIDDLNYKIDKIEKNIERAIEEIGQAEADMEAEKEFYNNRMVAMYISGNTGFLEVVLGSDSLSDLYSRIQIIKSITDLDEKIISELKAKRADIEDRKILLEEDKLRLDIAISELEVKKAKFEADKKEQQTYINKVKKQVTIYANAVSEDKAEIAETKQLIEEAKAKAAAEAAAKAAAEEAAKAADEEGKTSDDSSTEPPSRGTGNVSSNSIIAFASNYLGTPYQWGATGPNTFDCSGFTQYVFAHFAIKIPRVSRDQARAGTYVPKSQLQPGDLVFFAKPGRAVHHVGMYIGNNSYMHAPQTGDVIKISTLSSRSDYYTARRFN